MRERGAPGLEQYEHPKVRSELHTPWFSLLTLPQASEQLHKSCGRRCCYCCYCRQVECSMSSATQALHCVFVAFTFTGTVLMAVPSL